MCIPNLDETSQSTVQIKLLPVWEKGWSPYWNSVPCFNIDLCVVIGMWFCISMKNFVSIRRSPAELWRNIDFSRWRPYSLKATSVFSASECIRFRRWKSVWVPNFDEISQSTAEIKLLPVSEKGLPPYWNFTSDFDLEQCLILRMWFCFWLPNFFIIRRSTAGLWRHIDFTRWRP